MSTYGSFITTPVKSSVYKTGESISPKRNVSKVFKSAIMSNSSRKQKSDNNESAEGSLIAKLIENQISSEESYQNLLIQNKEMEIKILALQQEAQRLRKDFKKANTPIEELKTKISNAKASLIEKQKYLEKFYIHLESKLQSNMHSNLFGRLEKIQTMLEKKYLEQRQDLYDSLTQEKERLNFAQQQLQRQREYRDDLIKAYTQKIIQGSSHRVDSENYALSVNAPSQRKSNKKSSRQVSEPKSNKSIAKQNQQIRGSNNKKSQSKKNQKRQRELARQQYKKECKFYKENIQKLKKQKQIVEKDEKLLKLLLNIDQEHKKYSGYILNGYKKIFTIKYRALLLSRKSLSSNVAPSQLNDSVAGSMPDVEGLQKQLNQKVAERKVLEKQIEQRNIGLQKCKQKLNEQIQEYSLLEQRLTKVSRKNSDTKTNERLQNYPSPSNPRSTYTGNLSIGNHRSTYTSYQKHSQGFQQDL